MKLRRQYYEAHVLLLWVQTHLFEVLPICCSKIQNILIQAAKIVMLHLLDSLADLAAVAAAEFAAA